MDQDWEEGYGDDWGDISEYVKKRDNYACQSCGVRGRKYGPAELHAHHIRHKSEGGSNHPSNLVTLCWRCHNEAHDHFIQPMTEKARTNRPSISATPSRSSNTTKQKWKRSDGPADESLQRIVNDIYESIQDTITYQKQENDSEVTTKAGLRTLDQNDTVSKKGCTARGFSFSVLILTSPPIFVLSLLIAQSFLRSALITLFVAAIAYPFLYKRYKPLAEDLNRIDKLVGPYEKKKKEINNTIKQDGGAPNEDIEELKDIHQDILEIISRTNNRYLNDQFIDVVDMTNTHIKQLERGEFNLRT